MRLLLVEDDEILGDGLAAGLKMEGYAVDWLTNGKLADEALKLNSYELVVLDLNLPEMDGISILRALRSRKNETPVLVLTAKDTIPDRILGLDSGADDFVIKPFDLNEVCARLRALARRNEGRGTPTIEHNELAHSEPYLAVHEKQGENLKENIVLLSRYECFFTRQQFYHGGGCNAVQNLSRQRGSNTIPLRI